MFSTFKFMLPRGTIPSIPVNVVVSRSSAGVVTINWGAPSSNGNRPITSYNAYITNQNGGAITASATGPTTYSINFSVDNHGSYNGYVYASNVLGNSSTGGGGAACAYYGYNFSTGNCDGYTRYDTYTDGSCGFYRVDTEYNSPSCGYTSDPCAGCYAYGTFLTNYCDGAYNLYSVYADGCCGSYTVVTECSAVCGC